MTRPRSGFRVGLFLAMFALTTSFTSLSVYADTTFVLSGADFSGPTDNTGGNVTVQISSIAGGVQISIANNLSDSGAFIGSLYLNNTLAPLTGPTASCISCSAINGDTAAFSF